MESLGKHRRDWEDMATMDPLWAILSDPTRQFGKWDLEDFFASGRSEITALMRTAAQLQLPHGRQSALDFGCGVGRLTRAFTEFFETCYGLDISTAMLERARELTPSCKFLLNTQPNLSLFPSHTFDLVYTTMVLQHLPSPGLVSQYISELVRILKVDGLLVFQLPHHIPFRNRLQPRRRAYSFLRKLGVAPTFLYSTLTLSPIRMTALPEQKVARIIGGAGGKLVRIGLDNFAGPQIESRTYFVSR